MLRSVFILVRPEIPNLIKWQFPVILGIVDLTLRPYLPNLMLPRCPDRPYLSRLLYCCLPPLRLLCNKPPRGRARHPRRRRRILAPFSRPCGVEHFFTCEGAPATLFSKDTLARRRVRHYLVKCPLAEGCTLLICQFPARKTSVRPLKLAA